MRLAERCCFVRRREDGWGFGIVFGVYIIQIIMRLESAFEHCVCVCVAGNDRIFELHTFRCCGSLLSIFICQQTHTHIHITHTDTQTDYTLIHKNWSARLRQPERRHEMHISRFATARCAKHHRATPHIAGSFAPILSDGSDASCLMLHALLC